VEETQQLLKLHENTDPEGEKLELLEQQPVKDGVETFLDESLTASEKNNEIKKTDFVKLNDGNLLNERDIEMVCY